jgi:hypothetical protein
MRWVLAIVLGCFGTSCFATSCGFFADNSIESFGSTPGPGDPDYSPKEYAEFLYREFQGALDSDDRMVVVGTLQQAKVDDYGNEALDAKWLTEEAAKSVTDFLLRDVRVEFRASDVFDFSGGQLTDQGLIPLRDQKVAFEFSLGETGGAGNLLFKGPEPAIFAISFQQTSDGYYLTAQDSLCDLTYGAGLPAPDEAALRALTACIRNHGC